MAVYLQSTGGSTQYRNIKSISFAPEHDPRLETLPVCQYEADVVTDDTPETFIGSYFDLREDMGYQNATNTLLAGEYELYEAEQVGRGVVHIKARSIVGWLETRTLDAEYFENVSLQTFVERLFSDSPMNEGEPIWTDDDSYPFTIDSNSTFDSVTGFCPVQTARERLQWLAQSQLMHVVQYGVRSEGGLYLTKSLDYRYGGSPGPIANTSSKLVLPENTYRKPIVKKVTGYSGGIVYYYYSFSTTEHKGEDWASETWYREWDLSTQEWVDVPIYYRVRSRTYNDGTGDQYNVVEISGNKLMNYAYTGTQDSIAYIYFRKYEAEVDILQIKQDGTNDTYIWPGDRVRFYTDPDTIYEGIVKSVSFTFGALAKAKIIVSTDYVPVDVSYIELVFRFNQSAGFAKRRYTFPSRYTYYNNITIKNPPYYYMKDGKVQVIQPTSATTQLFNPGEAGTTATQYVSYTSPTI